MEISVKSVSKKYKGKIVLDKIGFNVSENSCLAVLGKNGSGKSTLFNIIADLVKADSGEIIWKDGEEEKSISNVKRNVGFALNTDFLINEFTGYEFLEFISVAYKVEGDVKQKISSLSKYFFENKDELNQKIATYSTGMKRKILICSSVLHQPDVLILDEPFSGLDIISANRLITFLRSYSKKRSILISSHNLTYIEKIATDILIIDQGDVQYFGKTSEFKEKGNQLIEDALFQYIQASEYKVSIDELDWLHSRATAFNFSPLTPLN